MISDEERREVAQKLRALDMSDIEVDGCIINSPEYAGLLLVRMLDVACDYRDGLHHFPVFFSAQAVVNLFADFIDRPTCRNLGLEEGTNGEDYDFFCSRCGFASDVVDPGYCPHCGAEVVE